jgi:hypothetical protein
MLADAKHVKAGLVGEFCGGQDLGVTLCSADRAAGVRIGGDVAEGVDAKFHMLPAVTGIRFDCRVWDLKANIVQLSIPLPQKHFQIRKMKTSPLPLYS